MRKKQDRTFGKSFTKIRSAVPENGCLFFVTDEKKQKKTKQETSVKHIRIRPICGCVNYSGKGRETAAR